MYSQVLFEFPSPSKNCNFSDEVSSLPLPPHLFLSTKQGRRGKSQIKTHKENVLWHLLSSLKTNPLYVSHFAWKRKYFLRSLIVLLIKFSLGKTCLFFYQTQLQPVLWNIHESKNVWISPKLRRKYQSKMFEISRRQ